MEKLQCKACGSYSMVPMEVRVEDEEESQALLGNDRESRFYTCHVCGDNWLSVKETDEEDCKITFVHQMGMQPELKRVAHMDTPIVLSENTIDHWEYFVDDEQIDGELWHEKLTNRRKVLKSICSN